MNLNQKTDEELMVMYQNGNDVAFQVLYDRHAGRIYALIRSKVSNAEMASDLFQEVFVKIHKSKGLYNKSFDVLPWLFTITRNTIIDGLRKQSKLPVSDATEVENLAAPIAEAGPGIGELTPAWAQLPENQRRALQMRYMDEKSFDEIARTLETSSENVRQLVSRGIKNLKNFFKQEKV